MELDSQTLEPSRLIAEAPHSFLFLSSLLGKPVIDGHGSVIGRLSDLAVPVASTFPPVAAFVVQRGRWDPFALTGRWSDVAEVGGDAIRLAVGIQSLKPSKLEHSGEILLREVLLDKQIVDMSGAKVVRVNDLHFLKLGGADLRLIHVDVGTRGLVRRLGWESFVDGLLRRLRPQANYLTAERLIQWQYVQPMSLDDRAHAIRLSVMQKQLAELHPADIADILTDLDTHERATVFRSLDAETAAETRYPGGNATR
ncbi:MAG: hypothetical protein HY270_16545 [Deltaproteobacteria bacterium]|nr:hypothetical protein [Deltaproteobacteria bacterium]